ncbi:unnamed protein product [Lupinus luteus]|uniref:Protein kinase domain-containing protein n=1 Tax=Lupinus luteus TaxID=3873 RepID=A0AAV1VRY4_LUPLU
MSMPFALSERAQMWLGLPSSMSSVAPGLPPSYQGSSVTTTPKRYRHHPNMQPYAVAPPLSKGQACDPICTDPLTATPFGSPCGCVFPVKVRLILDIAPLPIFPLINELEIEVASGTYLKQSQVRIMGVTADSENQGCTVIDINLVPLGEKFDDITFSVICERFWQKKVPLNKSLFGDFAVLSITYPEMPASAPHGPFVNDGSHPDPRYGAAGLIPFTANASSSKNQKMCPRTIIIIAVSSSVFLLALVGALSIMYKWSKVMRPSSAIGSALTSSLNTGPAMESMSSSRITRSRSMSLMSTMATSIPPVKRFSLSEIQKATDKFSSKRVLGEGGFGRVYRGYVAPEYAMTGHLLVKSDVYSYGVVLLELLTGRKPVDMSQPPGQENLVTYARPLLTTREGLEQLVDPSLAGTYEFDEMAKMASIASMCVHHEVTQRPFMGEVVQALKLIYNNTDESLGSKDSPELSDFVNDISPSENGWWNAEGEIPRLAYGEASPIMTMEYSSGPLEEIGNKLFSASSFISDDISLPVKYANRSGPLKTARSKILKGLNCLFIVEGSQIAILFILKTGDRSD